jgi:hypothetical protein
MNRRDYRATLNVKNIERGLALKALRKDPEDDDARDVVSDVDKEIRMLRKVLPVAKKIRPGNRPRSAARLAR